MGGVLVVVEVRLYATLRRHVANCPCGVFSLEVTEDCTVAELVQGIPIDLTEIHIIMINGVSSTMGSTLHAGDRLGLFPAVGGG
jgi:molybdopterin converting factor small subunit